MAIVKMSKFNLIFFPSYREHLLHSLQEFKYVHFTDLKRDTTLKGLALKEVSTEEKINAIQERIEQTKYILDTLEDYRRSKKGLKDLKKGLPSFTLSQLESKSNEIDLAFIYENTRKAINEKETLHRRIVNLGEEIRQLQPWTKLNYPFGKLKQLNFSESFITMVPNQYFEKFKSEIENIALSHFDLINRDHQYTYLLIVAHKTILPDVERVMLNNGISKINFDYKEDATKLIKQKKKKIKALEIDIDKNTDSLKSLTKYLEDIELLHDYLKTEKKRLMASEKLLSTETINIMQGYIPSKLEKQFKTLLKGKLKDQFYLQIHEADLDDPMVPILLENSKFFEAFESVTEMYALPKYNEIDPTPWFSIFYAIFFGMMIGDAGYGLLILFLTFGLLKLFNLKESQRSFFKFFYYLSFSTIIWGGIFGSFFGDVFPLPALIDTGEEYNLLLILSIALGIIHVFFALAVQAYIEIRRGKPLNALLDVGLWYMILIGAITYLISLFVSFLEPYKTISLIIMILGMLGILLTGGRNQKGFFKKIAGGLYSLYGISSYIGDFVSYSRLMALALASGFIAYAINLMVGMLFNIGFIGAILGIIIFVLGQGFNLFLSILSSYVHTLRLTYVEFFGKFYEGGGKPFQMFRNATQYINIK